jgi:hypothetical protein
VCPNTEVPGTNGPGANGPGTDGLQWVMESSHFPEVAKQVMDRDCRPPGRHVVRSQVKDRMRLNFGAGLLMSQRALRPTPPVI